MSRQARKEAAAAARDVLKSARVRKAGAAPMRKGAPMEKVSGGARAPPVPEVSSLSRAAHVPEQRSLGCGAGDFFNGSDDFFGSPEQSSQPWNPQSSDPAMCGEEAPRTEKRIFWSQEEDVRMISSWLLNSTDPTCGADRKNEQYWSDVEVTYNETTPSHRARNAKQIKDRFHKVNRWTDLFHSAWLKARMIYTSGYNDLMWIEKAHVFYIEDNKKLNLGPFVLMEVWNTVKNEAKWITYNNGLKAARKRKGPGNEKEGEAEDHTDVDELDDQPRPMGQKLAKKLKYATIKDVNHIDLEELDKFGKIQDEQNASRLKVLEVQQKLSSEKIEQTKLAHLAAKEQKEVA
ncbi:hypothetical protein PAHAL_7G019400 [Panicum hallii]|uniref:Uncharacterized protein n=1 Tax=Panicum hallii TaxID=206008 RepID=A0A2T8IAP3_9POAL|nr:hypothetical protein PAHAL_7G019400 [Panicum hallii]